MYYVEYGYTFDNEGHTIPMVHSFDTLEEANTFAQEIYAHTKEIVCVEEINSVFDIFAA